MRGEYHKVARAYVLYREERARERAKAENREKGERSSTPPLRVERDDGSLVRLTSIACHW